nr:hypothetical protein GCM10025732_26230 [Glycomyces mayteni]
MGDNANGTPRLHRRSLFQVGAGAAAAASLAGCAALDEGPDGTAAGADELADLLPTYTPYEGGITPDLPGEPDGTVTPGFLSRPAEPVQAITEPVMTTGEDITAITPLWNPTPPGLPDNSYFTTVNEILGGTVVFNIADGNNYLDKITTTLASGDVPDMFQIPGWEIVNISDFGEAANELFADLSPTSPVTRPKRTTRSSPPTPRPHGRWASSAASSWASPGNGRPTPTPCSPARTSSTSSARPTRRTSTSCWRSPKR